MINNLQIEKNDFSKGSEWRKWDLHVHTPASFYFNGSKKLREMSAEEKTTEIKIFIDIVNKSDVAVFCLMDYWTFDWYLELQEYITANPDELKKTVFPGMELRIESPTNYRLNIHVI
jgi:predicted metal-dependent phosphoesterase TrpH